MKAGMPTPRRIALITAAALAVATVTISAGSASFGSSARPDQASPSRSSGVTPLPDAPHVGHVKGAQYGPDIPIDNPHAVHAFKALHQQMRGQISGTRPAVIHEYVGTSFDESTSGAQATQSVSTKIKPADPNTTLYTPTMYPSGGSCIEVSTAYFHTSQVVAAWDWCKAITFVAQVTIDKSFMQTYTLHRNYSVQIVQTDPSNNTWTAYLYNYKASDWESFFSQNGTSQVGLAEGWDIYELYSNLDSQGVSYACADLEGRRVEARHIMVGVDGSLVRATPTNAGHDYDVPLADFHCPSLVYNMIRQYSHWKAIG